MSKLGHPIAYRVPEEHKAVTVKGKDADGNDIEQHGSVHHAARTEFAGQITHTVKDGKHEVHDVVIFVPGKPPLHLTGVTEGDGPGQLTLVK